MQAPRFTGCQLHVTLAALLLGLLVPALAHAEPGRQEQPPEENCSSPREAGNDLTDEQRLRVLAILFSTMTWSGEFPPPDHPPPLVTRPPHRPPHWKPPHHVGVPGTPTPTGFSPEPASFASGLFGSTMACLYAWLRKRRARRVAMAS
jgi:hypothetical protein